MKSITGLAHDKMNPRSPRNKSPMLDGIRPDEAPFVLGYDIGFNGEIYDRWTGKMIHYVVQENDTLSSISKAFKIKENEIILINRKLGNLFSDRVNEGQKLTIPVMSNVPFLKAFR